MTPIRLGLIGCGRLAEAGYAPALAAVDEMRVTAVADPDPARCDRLVRLLTPAGAPPVTHASAGELIGSGAVDAVVIASPPAEHVWQAELASRAGLSALVEKPPAPAAAGAERLTKLERPPWVGFNRRFQHAEALLALVPASGELDLELDLRYRRDSWRPVSVADDAAADLAPHLVDLALVLAGSQRARVRSARLSATRAELELELERGRARISCATDRAHRELVTVRDGSGRALGRSTAGGPLGLLSRRLPGREHPLVASLRAQLVRFGAACRGGDPGVLATAADGARAMAVIDDARRVAANGAAP